MTERTEPKLILDEDAEANQMEPVESAVTVRKFRKTESRPVVVTDIRMGFWSMVWFMVKWSIASIPAAIILIAVFELTPELLRGLRLG